jgi:PAS domain S-box-containing protein
MKPLSKARGVDALSSTQELTTQLRRRIDQLSALNKIAAVVSQSLDLNATLETAMDAVLSVIPVDASGVSLIDEHAGELILRAQRGWKQDFVSIPMRLKLGAGLSGLVITTGEVVITGDLREDDRLVVPAVAEEGIQAMVMAPMHARGKIIGILSVMSYRPYQFDEQEIDLLKAVADQVGVALDNARLFEATREAERQMTAVLQSTADAIVATDSHGQVTLINRAAEVWFSILASSVVGKPLSALPFPDEIRDGLQKAITEFEGSQRGFEAMLPNGKFIAAVVSPVAMLTGVDDSTEDGWVVVFQDITHIKEAERARLQFVQTAAHDLRNPLGATLSALTMLHRGWKNPTETEDEIFSIALRGINRMQDLIDDLLNLEKLESGLDFSVERVNVYNLIERTASDMGVVVARRNQRLSVEMARELPPLWGNEHWLARALMNLINNAHKYGNDDGQITLRVYSRDGEYHMEVQDDGPGIPLERQPRLFERFYRVPETKDKVHGTGLGLAIVRSIAERHGGRAEVHSVPGQGATFSIIIPMQAA